MNLIIALLIGIGFGFLLEQAGFSSTKNWLDSFTDTILPFCGCFSLPA
jgi:hypothetical protein